MMNRIVPSRFAILMLFAGLAGCSGTSKGSVTVQGMGVDGGDARDGASTDASTCDAALPASFPSSFPDTSWDQVVADHSLCSAFNEFVQYFAQDCGGYHVLVEMSDVRWTWYFDSGSGMQVSTSCPGFVAPDCSGVVPVKLPSWCASVDGAAD